MMPALPAAETHNDMLCACAATTTATCRSSRGSRTTRQLDAASRITGRHFCPPSPPVGMGIVRVVAGAPAQIETKHSSPPPGHHDAQPPQLAAPTCCWTYMVRPDHIDLVHSPLTIVCPWHLSDLRVDDFDDEGTRRVVADVAAVDGLVIVVVEHHVCAAELVAAPVTRQCCQSAHRVS